jgi:hypothetical protein
MNTPKNTQNGFATFQPMPTHAEATAGWRASQPKTRDGENKSHLPEFLLVAQMVVSNYATFTKQDFFSLLKNMDIPPLETQTLFNSWVEKMQADGRIKRTVGAYDDDIFSVV